MLTEVDRLPNEAVEHASPLHHFNVVNADKTQSPFFLFNLKACFSNSQLRSYMKQLLKMGGYSKLADLMGDDRTDGHYLIFQKFEAISAQNLLYLQAEIKTLKNSIDQIADSDSKSEDPEKQLFTGDWAALSSSPDSAQWDEWLKLRRKLKAYCKQIYTESFKPVLT